MSETILSNFRRHRHMLMTTVFYSWRPQPRLPWMSTKSSWLLVSAHSISAQHPSMKLAFAWNETRHSYKSAIYTLLQIYRWYTAAFLYLKSSKIAKLKACSGYVSVAQLVEHPQKNRRLVFQSLTLVYMLKCLGTQFALGDSYTYMLLSEYDAV